MDYTTEEIIKRLKIVGYAIAIAGIFVYFYADDLSRLLAGKVVPINGSGS